MSLTIGIGDDFETMHVRLAFDPEVYFWVISPEFEKLHKVTGKLVTLYDYAIFKPYELAHLERLVREVGDRVQKKTDIWKEHVGTQIKPEKKEIYKTVSKSEFTNFLSKFKAIVLEAKESNKAVLFFGD